MDLQRDQVTLDQAQRPWNSFGEVQQGALLVELSASLRRRLASMEVEQELAAAYRSFAQAARQTGGALISKHGVPFVPDAPFQWSRLRLEQVHERMREIRDWAASTVVSEQQALPVRHTALDLSEAGRELERQLERTRAR